MNAMDEIPYEPKAFYIFDRRYFDLALLFTFNLIGSNFIIRERVHLQYEIIEGEDILENPDNILYNQMIRLMVHLTRKKYPVLLRVVGYYSLEYKKFFTYLANNFGISAIYIVLLYKNQWQVELLFKWIKQHLNVKHFKDVTENAVKIQIYAVITAYCIIAIVEHDPKLNRNTFYVLRILRMSLFGKTPIRELFEKPESVDYIIEVSSVQLCCNFKWTLMIFRNKFILYTDYPVIKLAREEIDTT